MTDLRYSGRPGFRKRHAPDQQERRLQQSFLVYGHRLEGAGRDGAWRLTVDETPYPAGYSTVAEAWAAGVHEAERLATLGTMSRQPELVDRTK
jgi:hypothetical protein